MKEICCGDKGWLLGEDNENGEYWEIGGGMVNFCVRSIAAAGQAWLVYVVASLYYFVGY